jgi:hypothetical protein
MLIALIINVLRLSVKKRLLKIEDENIIPVIIYRDSELDKKVFGSKILAKTITGPIARIETKDNITKLKIIGKEDQLVETIFKNLHHKSYTCGKHEKNKK